MIQPIQLTPNMDKATMVNAINDVFRQIESSERSRVVKDETGVNRILIGRDPNGKYVLKVSKEGVDVLEAKDNQLIFNSAQNILKIRNTGEVTFNSGDYQNVGGAFPYQATKTIGLTDITGGVKTPVVQAFIGFPFGYVGIPYYNIDYNGVMSYYVYAQWDETVLNITVMAKEVLSTGLPVKYYIYEENVN